VVLLGIFAGAPGGNMNSRVGKSQIQDNSRLPNICWGRQKKGGGDNRKSWEPTVTVTLQWQFLGKRRVLREIEEGGDCLPRKSSPDVKTQNMESKRERRRPWKVIKRERALCLFSRLL